METTWQESSRTLIDPREAQVRDFRVDRDSLAKPLQVRIGQVSAHCLRCGGTDFLHARRQRAEAGDGLICATCGTETSRTALLEQITREVIHRAQKALKEADAIRQKAQRSRS
jgi:hypothetical protein